VVFVIFVIFVAAAVARLALSGADRSALFPL
jgi:hypothetical protein